MNDHIDIYAVDNERAWESAVRSAIEMAWPQLEESPVKRGADYHYPTILLQWEHGAFRWVVTRQYEEGVTGVVLMEMKGELRHWAYAHREPIGAICLALAEYSRQRQEVTT